MLHDPARIHVGKPKQPKGAGPNHTTIDPMGNHKSMKPGKKAPYAK